MLIKDYWSLQILFAQDESPFKNMTWDDSVGKNACCINMRPKFKYSAPT